MIDKPLPAVRDGSPRMEYDRRVTQTSSGARHRVSLPVIYLEQGRQKFLPLVEGPSRARVDHQTIETASGRHVNA